MARDLNIAAQALDLRRRYPTSEVQLRKQQLTWTHAVQPADWSREYTIQIEAGPSNWPMVQVLAPELEPDSEGRLPHVYPDGTLCLATPGQWRRDMLLATTFFPWTLEWLAYYEIWSVTRVWHGDGDLDTDGQSRILHHYKAPRPAEVARLAQIRSGRWSADHRTRRQGLRS